MINGHVTNGKYNSFSNLCNEITLSERFVPYVIIHSRYGHKREKNKNWTRCWDSQQIFDRYYEMRTTCLSRLSSKVVNCRITGKEYTRRVTRLNQWLSYKLQQQQQQLTMNTLLGKNQ